MKKIVIVILLITSVAGAFVFLFNNKKDRAIVESVVSQYGYNEDYTLKVSTTKEFNNDDFAFVEVSHRNFKQTWEIKVRKLGGKWDANLDLMIARDKDLAETQSCLEGIYKGGTIIGDSIYSSAEKNDRCRELIKLVNIKYPKHEPLVNF